MGFFDFFSKEKKETLDKGLEKTKEGVFSKLARLVAGRTTVDDDLLDDLEEVLITSDVGIETTLRIIERIQQRVARDKYLSANELQTILREEIVALLTENNNSDDNGFVLGDSRRPYVIMVVGVNGVGKTTTIGKLAYQYKKNGYKVYLGAADTFRAAAVEQLDIWGERVGVPVIKQKMGADPASVAFDTLSSAKAGGADVVIIDTAGRLHNKVGLMNELTKIRKVMDKVVPGAPDEILLVLDGSTGSNRNKRSGSNETGWNSKRRSGYRNLRPVQNTSKIHRFGRRNRRLAAVQPQSICRVPFRRQIIRQAQEGKEICKKNE